MPGNNELRLKFGGYVDRQELKNDVREAINEVNKENSGSGKGVKIPVYDIEDIKEQGLKVIKATEDVEKQIRRTFKPIKGEIDVKSITNANNEIDQYNIKIVERNQIIDQYILKLRQVKELDGSTYPAFVQTRLTSSDNGNGSLLVKQTKELTKARAEIENLMNQFLTGNGKKILGDDSRVNEILNQLADAEKLVNKLSTTAGRNPRDKMEDVTTLINKIKAQANDYYEVEEAEKKAAKQREEDNQKAIKSTEEQTAALKKYKAEVNDLLDTYVRTNGTKLLTKDKNSSDIKDRSVELLGDINKLNKTAGLNTPEQMEYIKDTIGLLKKEADEYYRIEKNQKSLIDSQTKEVEAVQNKVTALSNRYIDKTGSNQLFDTKNIEDVNGQISKIMAKVSELRANAGKASYNFDANISVLNNMYDALEKNAKGYYKLETEQRKSSELFQKQDKDVQQYLLDIQKVKDTALNSQSGKRLLDEENIKTVRSELAQAENILRNMINTHKRGDIIDTKNVDSFIIKMKQVDAQVSTLRDMESLMSKEQVAAEKTAQAYENQKYKLEALSQEARKLYDSTFNSKNNLVNEKNITDAQKKLKNLSLFIDGLYTKHNKGDLIPEDALTRFDLKLKETTQDIRNMKDEESLQKALIGNTESQLNALNTIENKVISIQSKMLDGNKITTPSYITDISNQTANALNTIDSLRNKAGSITDSESRNLTNIVATLQREADEYSRIDSAQQKTEGNLQKQKKDLNDLWLQLQGVSRTALNPKAGNKLTDIEHIRTVREEYGQLIELVYKLQKQNESGKIIDIDTMQKATSLFAKLNQDVNVFRQEETLANNLAKAIEKDNQTIWDQKFILDAYYLEIKKIKETTLNPTSASTLLASDDIKKVTDNFERFEQNYNKFRSMNSSGSLINKNDLKETDMILKEIHQDIGIIGTEMRKEMTADTSMQHMIDQTNVYRQTVIGLVQSLQREGLYSGKIKDEMIGIVKELAQIKVPKDVTSFNLHLSAIEKKVGNVKDAMKAAFETERLQQKLQLFSSQVQGYMQQNTRAAMLFKSSFEQIQKGISNASTSEDLLRLQNDFKILQQNINNAGKAGQTFGERMSGALKKFMMWTGMTNTVMYLVRSIRQMITHTKELDSAMVSLKKVTDETDTVYEQMFANATEKAKELNTSIKNVINSTAEFAKLGFNTDQAQALAEVANVYANVGELDIQSATESLVSTINGFKDLSADDAWKIIDEFNNIGNKFSISSGGIGEALKRSAASLSESNNSLEESIALVTTANSVIQDPEKVGTALRTMSLRIRGVKAELEKAGLETEGMVESTAKLRELVLASTGVDILEKDQKTFRSTYEILLDISKVWGTMNDELQKSAVLEALAGKLQSNILASILNNGEMLADVYDKAGKSENSAMEEQNRWSESLEAHAGKIEAIFESISAKVFDSDSLKSIYDGLANILNLIDKIISNGQGLQLLSGLLGGVLGGSGNGVINFNTFGKSWAEINKNIEHYNLLASSGKEKQKAFALTIQETNAGLSRYLVGLKGTEAGIGGYIASTISATAKTIGLRVAVTALNAAFNGLIAWVLSMGISSLVNWAKQEKELAEAFEDDTNKINDRIETLEDYQKKIDNIVDSSKTEKEKISELNGIKDELHEKYRIEIEDIKDATDARNDLIKAIKEESLSELNDNFNNTNSTYLKYKNAIENPTGNKKISAPKWMTDLNNWLRENIIPTYDLYGDSAVEKSINDYFSYNTNKGNSSSRYGTNGDLYLRGNKKTNISDEVKKAFDKFDERQLQGGESIFTFDVGDGTENVLEYYDKLKTTLDSLSESKTTLGNKWTKSDEKIYQITKDTYDELTDYWYGDEHRADTFLKDAEVQAKRILAIVEKEHDISTMSAEEYREAAYGYANGDTWIVSALNDLIQTSNEAKKELDAVNSPFAEILASLSKVAETSKTVKEEISKADEQFEKLTKTIEDNKDVDKFFSASDIIEILELYPSLNDAILETAYGYKIEEEALESLRAEKVKEKKTALQAQLDEAQTVLDATRLKLDAYRQDLNGVENVTQAKIRLAALEAKLAQVGSGTTNPYYNNNSLEEQIALYKDYINASELYEKQQQEVDKLGIELKVLGTAHDKAKNAADNQTDALNTQKDSIKALNDEMKEAKDYIDDLIKLTMEYIKKSKDLEKSDLKDRLDNFKKLIEKQKELLKLEKDQYDFEKDLKEQNRDLLKIQQELDALSIDGINYSLEDLKRKAELEEKLAEQSDKRTDFLYDHEIDVREKALEAEEKSFTEKLETQIKEIEDYLSKEGRIRQDAIDLINGKSEEFYNNLLEYNMTYTDRSRYEFQKLWDSAYDAILKYAGGELNVELALINLIGAMNDADQQLKNIENSINNIKHATDNAKKSMYDFAQVIADTQAKAKQLYDAPIGPQMPYHIYDSPIGPQKKPTSWTDKRAQQLLAGFLPKFHDGGIVGGISNEKGEVLAKLLSGEVVATEAQARNFMEHTLPKLASNNYTTNNSSVAPVINIGDIVVNGNADSSILNKLNEVRQNIVDDVFKVVNNQRNTFAGGRVRAY